jgi:hypothetical protein
MFYGVSLRAVAGSKLDQYAEGSIRIRKISGSTLSKKFLTSFLAPKQNGLTHGTNT